MEDLDKHMRLESRGLTFAYPGADKPVLENLSFSMDGPGFNAVFGPSGVGKTSFAKLLAGNGARQKEAGEGPRPIHYQGIHTILYTYNQERLPGWAATGRHLDKVCPEGRQELKQALIDIFQVRPVLGSRFSQLSMGQQNRMNLIRYLIQDFDLMVMDESLANVDEALREAIILAIKERFSDRFFLYISHNLMEVARLCREILVLGPRSKGAVMVRGQDAALGRKPDPKALDRTMLEIMNAV